MKIAVLGPSGTFSESSLKATLHGVGVDLHLLTDLEDLFQAVDDNVVDLAWLPWWNSACGFLVDHDQRDFFSLLINPEKSYAFFGEAFEPLDFALLGIKGAEKSDLKTIHVNPYATTICKTFFQQNSQITVVTEHSSSSAAKKVAALNDKTISASASPSTGNEYGLVVLQNDMTTPEEKATMQFVLFGKSNNTQKPIAAHDRLITSCVIKSGSVSTLAEESGLNILAIRPSPHGESTYLVDVHGAYSLPDLQAAFSSALVYILGTYEASIAHVNTEQCSKE